MSSDHDQSGDAVSRPNSRLEIDDPKHCKECGGELAEGESEDAQGRPLNWGGGQWHSIELCPECWTEKRLDKLRRLCMDRYRGQCSEVLWNAR